MTLRRRAQFGCLVLAVLIWFGGFWLSIAMERTVRQGIGQRCADWANTILSQTDQRFHSRLDAVLALAQRTSIQDALTQSNRQFEAMVGMDAYIHDQDGQCTAAGPQQTSPLMRSLIDAPLSEELRIATGEQFYQSTYGYKVFAETFVTNRYGANVAQSERTSDYYQADESWWQEAARVGLYLGPVVYEASAGVHAVEIGKRIDDPGGALLGVMKCVLDIRDIVAQVRLEQNKVASAGGRIALVDEAGKAVDPSSVWSGLEALTSTLRRTGQQNGYVVCTAATQDTSRLVAFARSQAPDRGAAMGWTLVIEYPTRCIFAPVIRLGYLLVAVTSIAGVAIALMTYAVLSALIRPIDRLHQAVARTCGGERPGAGGEVRSVLGSFEKISEDLGEATRMVGELQREIEVRTRAERVLSAREHELNTAHDQLNQILSAVAPLCVVGWDYRIVVANDALCAWLGLAHDAVQGRRCYEVMPQPRCLHADCPIPRLMARPEAFQYETSFEHPGGRSTHAMVRATPYRVAHQADLTGTVLTFMDISDHKRAEQAIRDTNAQLEDANRDLMEMQSQIIQSEKLASLGQLAAGVAHEMNTPVGFVASNFETLQNYMAKLLDLLHQYETLAEAVEDGLRERRLEILNHIKHIRKDLKIDFLLDDIGSLFGESREGLQRVTEIVQNLRDFSRVDQVRELDHHNLNDSIRATLIVARNEIKHDAEVVLDLGDIPQIRCRAGQINQVILNILVNAVQALRSQGRREKGTITIRTALEGDQVVCQITDDGPGIPPEIINKVFDPFFTTKPVGKGTGLGLSISHDLIVNKHKGQLVVESPPGQGACFTIRLPQTPCQEATQECPSAVPTAPGDRV